MPISHRRHTEDCTVISLCISSTHGSLATLFIYIYISIYIFFLKPAMNVQLYRIHYIIVR
jgi:hypothetical protein